MTAEPGKSDDRDATLDRVLAKYLHAEEVGQPLDQQSFIAEYVEFAADLRSFFSNRPAMDRVARPLIAQAAIEPTLGLQPAAPDAAGIVRYVGDYELLDEIARGGMGVVYK